MKWIILSIILTSILFNLSYAHELVYEKEIDEYVACHGLINQTCEVKILEDFFPKIMKANKETTISWRNFDNVTHNISSPTLQQIENQGLRGNYYFDIDFDVNPNETQKKRFNKPIILTYHDKYNPAMTGQILFYEEPAIKNIETETIYHYDSYNTLNKASDKLVNSIAITPTGKMFFTEIHGDVRIMEKGVLVEERFLSINDSSNFHDENITHGWGSILIDPNHVENKFLYLTRFVTEDPLNFDYEIDDSKKITAQLIRVTDVNNKALDYTILKENIPLYNNRFVPLFFNENGTIHLSAEWPILNGNEILKKSSISTLFNDMKPTNAIFYQGEKFPELKNKLIVGTWILGMIKVISLDSSNQKIESQNLLISGYKPITAIAESPDGFVYFSTPNSIEKIISIDSKFISPSHNEIRPIALVVLLIISAFFIFIISKKIQKKVTNII